MDIMGLNVEILLLLKLDISAVINSELKNALAEDFNFLKRELQTVKMEIISNTAVINSEIEQIKANRKQMERGY